jgi:hypothetical protein
VREAALSLKILNEIRQLQQDGKLKNRVVEVARDHRAAGWAKGLRLGAWEVAMAPRAHRARPINWGLKVPAADPHPAVCRITVRPVL